VSRLAKLDTSPGLALDAPAPTFVEPVPKRPRQRRRKRGRAALYKLSYKDRIAAIAQRRDKLQRVIVRLPVEEYEMLLMLCERWTELPPEGAARVLRYGLPRMLDEQPELPPKVYDDEAASYRASQQLDEDPLAKKKLLRAVGVQMT
jgi:hypothetical protein